MNAVVTGSARKNLGPVAGSTLSPHAFALLSLTVAWVLVLHAPHLPGWLCALLALVLGGRWWQRRRYGGRLRWWLKLLPTLLLPLIVVLTYGSLFGRAPGSALAVGMLVLKLLESESPRDARTGIAFACFGLMSALLFDQSLILTVFVTLGLIPALATLRALQARDAPAHPLSDLLPATRMLAVAAPLALVAFVFVPRLSSPLWGAPSFHQARTGLSDTLAPGTISKLLMDGSPAMRVSFKGTPPAPRDRYFRAYVMWHFDGRAWSSLYTSPRKPAPIEALQTISYNVHLEPTGSHLLPSLDLPLRVPAQAILRHDREMYARKPINQLYSYTMRSALRYRWQSELSAQARQRALQLPRGLNPRTHQLADAWRQRFDADASAIVDAALALFHNGGFRYTLTPPELGRNSVDDFLFSTRAGYCEHYASAFTILMRAAGVPARVVTGYQGGYWNSLSKYLLVRQSDAHAWSEVWLQNRGWVRVDPTAAVRPERVHLGAAAAAGDSAPWYQSGWLQGLRNRWDIVNRWWGQAVLGFDALRQRGLLTPFGVRRADTRELALALAISLSLLLGIAVAWSLRRRSTHDPLRAAQLHLERHLARLGVTRRLNEGPRDYFARAANALPARARQLEALGKRYLQLRYGKIEPVPERVRGYQRQIVEFRRADGVKSP